MRYKNKDFQAKSITLENKSTETNLIILENKSTETNHIMQFSKFQMISSLGLASAKMLNMEKMSANLTETQSDLSLRTFGTIEQILLSDYKNYGCWCYLAQTPKGKGKPVNAIDEACRSLHCGC